MFFKSNLRLLLFLSFIFTIIIFFVRNYFFNENIYSNSFIEESFIDRSLEIKDIEVNVWIEEIEKIDTGTLKTSKENNIILDTYKDKQKDNLHNIYYIYIPLELKDDIWDYIKSITSLINSSYFFYKISDLTVEFYQEIFDVRWKMKNKKVKLFWPEEMSKEELFTVFTHELWHYIDLYFLINTLSWDKSLDFYKISWDSTKVMKKWQDNKDFVSGYAMTNKYEDFAESFIYYVLHNRSFYKKTLKSKFLKEKYNYFKIYLFKNNEFYLTDFSKDEKIKDYYRDITKIKINLDKTLQYLSK